MIEIKNVSKAYGNKNLFEDLSLTIEAGEFIIFSGPSGCGKTTLLNMVGGLEKIEDGTIIVDGINIAKKFDTLKFFGEKVGFLFQNFALIENKTVRQNLEIVKKSNRSKTSFSEALTEVGLADKLQAKVYSLSGGEQQRLALARLMVKQCDIILADEPTGSLDQGNADAVMQILMDLNKKGKTIILVTHDEQIKQLGDRIIELKKTN